VKGAAGALLALSGADATHAQLRAAGAVPAALRVVRATQRADTRLLCLLLASCLHTGAREAGEPAAANDDVQAALAQFDCSEHLVALLRAALHGDGRYADCLWSVAQAAHHSRVAAVAEATAEQLAAAGAAPLLVELLCSARAEHASARLDAAGALLRLSYVPRLVGALRDAGAPAAAAALAAGAADEELADVARGLLRQLTAPEVVAARGAGARFDVFLSHKRADAKDFARALHTVLIGVGLRVFLDYECLEDVHELPTFVARSANLLFVMTDNVLDSQWCIAELAAAADAGVNVVLVKKHGARWRDAHGHPVRARSSAVSRRHARGGLTRCGRGTGARVPGRAPAGRAAGGGAPALQQHGGGPQRLVLRSLQNEAAGAAAQRRRRPAPAAARRGRDAGRGAWRGRWRRG
jgi:hypothetical protein